jgi:hypothetical protein
VLTFFSSVNLQMPCLYIAIFLICGLHDIPDVFHVVSIVVIQHYRFLHILLIFNLLVIKKII